MSSISLRKQQVINLKKEAGIGNVKAEVKFVLDKSGSMSSLYSNGTVQDICDRILPLALAFDDNGEADFIIFNDTATEVEPLKLGTITGLVGRIMNKGGWGSTNYAPPLEMILAKSGKLKTETVTKSGFLGFGGKTETKVTKIDGPADYPIFVIFMTDGNNFDKKETEDAIALSSKTNIFVQFVGIGGESFPFLQKLDTLKDSRRDIEIDNVSFMHIKDIKAVTDDELYRGLMKEFPSWYQQAVKKGFVKQQ